MNPLIPMWALTGHPSKEQLQREMRRFLAGGIEQVMLYPRTGCECDYMSEEWFRVCGDCISFAADHGMRIWLYDEFNWPSGSCNRAVPRQSRDFCGKRLCRQNDQIIIEYADPDTAKLATDLLNPAAVDRFIELTHERYAARFSKYFGSVIVGIFTDEPGMQYFSDQDKPPYYDGAFADYQTAYGRDARADYLSNDKGFYARWTRMIGERFRRVFLARYADWCAKHGLFFTGHLMHDDCVCLSAQSHGNIFEALDHFSLPGVDEIKNDPLSGNDDFIFAHIDAMRRRGKKGGTAELFAYGPSSLSYIRRKQMIWYAAAYGADHYFMAVSHLDIRGNRIKKHYFCDFSPASPDFFAGAPLLAETAGEAAAYAQKTPIASVALRFPYRAALEMSHRHLQECEAGNRLKEVAGLLTDLQIPWILIDENEASDAPIRLSFTEEEIIEEKSGKRYCRSEDIKPLLSSIARPVSVCLPDGTLAGQVLVRCYTDGGFIVVDRAVDEQTSPRRLLLRAGAQTRKIVLPRAGVITDQSEATDIRGDFVPASALRVRYDAPNVYRPMFFDRASETFCVDEPLNVTLFCRIDEEKATVLLDGKEIVFDKDASALPSSMEKLYRASAPVLLERGEHALQTDAKDLPHFPAVLVTGDFAFGDRGLRRRDARFAQGLSFFGCAAVCFEVDLPKRYTPLYLAFDDNRLVGELYVNEEFVGACAFAPYRYELPDLAGRVKLELCLYTGYAPLFGDLKAATEKYFTVPEKLFLRHLRIGRKNQL